MFIRALRLVGTRPLIGRAIWVLFAVLFYQSGETFTVWLLEPESFTGGVAWFWVGLFPLLVPVFFVVNRYLGCATGDCTQGQCRLGTDRAPGH